VYFLLGNRTWRQYFFYKRPKKKQLYRQEVPERRSKIYTNKKFPGNLEFPGGIPPAVCLEETLLLRREKRVQQMSAVAGDAGEQTLISISTDAVERPRSVITISESMVSSKERLQTHSIIH